MDDEADAAREYDRLRGELADFVLSAVAERIAAGQQPKLGQALVDAIDRQVGEAIAARLDRAEWPDPAAFADEVIAAAAGRSGGRAASVRAAGGRRAATPPSSRLTRGRLILIGIAGVIAVAALTFFLLRGWNAPPTDTVVMNAQTIRPEPAPTPDGTGNLQSPPANAATPPPPAPGNQAGEVR